MFALPKFSFPTLPPLPRLISSHTRWLEKRQTSILSAAVIITVANIISSLSGLIRQRLLIAEFFDTQASQEAFEALLVAFQIPDMMFQLIVLGALSAAFIPVFTSVKKKSTDDAFAMSAVVVNILLLVFIAVSVVIFIFAHPLTAWRTGANFTPEQVYSAAQLTRIMLVAQLFFALSNMLSAILQTYQRFILPSIAPIFYNIGIVLGVYTLSGTLGIYSAGVGVCLGAFLHMIIQLPLAYKVGFRFKPSLNIRLPGVKELFSLIPARVITIGISELQHLGLAYFATSLGNLSFVVIRLASMLITIPIRLFGIPISQASLPFLSQEAHEKDQARFKSLVRNSLHQIAFFAFPAAVLLLILRVPVVRLLFGTSNFPWSVTVTTGKVVAIIALSIGAQAMVQLLIRAFHSLKDTRTPLFITLGVASVYLVGCWATIQFTDWGIIGIAGVTAASAFFELGLFLLSFHKKVSGFITSEFIIPQAKMLTASFLMAVSLYLPFRILDELIFNTARTTELIALTITTGTIGMVVYIYFAALFNIKELQLVRVALQSLSRWRMHLTQTQELITDTRVEDDSLS